MIRTPFITLTLLVLSCSAYADTLAAKVLKTEGGAFALNSSNESRVLNRGDDVYVQDTVTTTTTGFLTLRFTDGTVVDLAQNSKYIVKNYNYNPSEPKANHFDSEILEGGFRAITGKVASTNPPGFSTKARLTTLTVRGTYFYLITPKCDPKKPRKTTGCDDVVQFTVEGVTDINYNGQDYVLGSGQSNTTFNLSDGVASTSDKIPISLPVSFSSDVNGFLGSLGGAGGIPGSTTSAPGGSGGGSSPCGTLNAVGGALPK